MKTRDQEVEELIPLDENKIRESLIPLFMRLGERAAHPNDLNIAVNIVCSRFGTKPIVVPSVGDIEESMRNIPSTHVPISQMNGKIYHYMCKSDIAQAIHAMLSKEVK